MLAVCLLYEREELAQRNSAHTKLCWGIYSGVVCSNEAWQPLVTGRVSAVLHLGSVLFVAERRRGFAQYSFSEVDGRLQACELGFRSVVSA